MAAGNRGGFGGAAVTTAYQTNSQTGDLVGPMGWGVDTMQDDERLQKEQSIIKANQDHSPVFWSRRPSRMMPAGLQQRLEDSHQKRNMSYADGSIDLRLITEIAFGELWQWMAQIIGSCVESGGNRAWTLSQLWQIVASGDPEEPLGKMRLGVDTVSHYGPLSYGLGRRRGGLRRGDGSWCGVQVESYMQDGVLDCNTPQLHRITGTSQQDFPEPQNGSLYRAFGSWQYLDDLLPYCDYRLLEAVDVNDAQQSVELLRAFKPHMICSNWGFGPTSRKINGYTVYRRQGSWAHNMTIAGVIVGEDGNIYIIVLNSWGPNAHRDGEIFVIPIELYSQWLRDASCIAIGDIDLPDSTPNMTF
jgi:hypothetical protein